MNRYEGSSPGKRLSRENAIHVIRCRFVDEQSKTEYETSWGWSTKELAMNCLDSQRKRPDCVSADYLDPTAPVKAEQFE